MSSIKIILILFLIFTSCHFLLAHGDLHDRIVEVSKQVEMHPDSASLYFLRGKLYNRHFEHKKALKDFKKCNNLKMYSPQLDLEISKAYQGCNKNKKAIKKLNKLLDTNPDFVLAIQLKGRIFRQEERYEEAAQLLEDVIEKVDKPRTDNYVEAADTWLMSDSLGKGQAKALSVIEKGLRDLGNIIVLLKYKVEIHMLNNDFDSALKVQGQIIESSSRKERALYKRALIFMEKQDIPNARKDLNVAFQELSGLPSRIRNTTSTKELEQDMMDLRSQL